MRMAFFSAAVLAALTLSGMARADISETINGTVLDGIDNLGDFGPAGADLTGAAVSLTFSYNYGQLVADSSYFNEGFVEFYNDYAVDGAVTESVTIDNRIVSVTNSFPGSVGSVANYLSAATPPTLIASIYNASPPGNDFIALFVFGANNLAVGNLGDQGAIDAFISTPGSFNGGNEHIQLSNSAGTVYDFIDVSSVVTPEPTLWVPLALGLGGMAVLKFRRRERRS